MLYFLGLVLFLACTPMALLDFAIPKWKADKNVRIQDAYKWTYQATRGGEHAVPDTESARKWLDGEWQTIGKPASYEAVWEPLCSGAGIGRLNLRPFKTRGGKADDLLEAFLASSREYRGEETDFVDAWAKFGKRLKKKSVGKLDYKSWTELDAQMKEKKYPAIHHSETYEKSNHPAYRILTSAEMKKLLARSK
jgi:hypothetical protein